MALLDRTALLALMCCGCTSSDSLGHVAVWLYDCRGAGHCEAGAASEHFEVQAFVEPSVSRYAPRGLYTYFELPRADGTRGLVELDIPTEAAGDIPLDRYQASYRELSGDRLSFSADEVSGQLLLPPPLTGDESTRCACEEGAFALRFAEPGPDQEPGTEDDQVRELHLGRLGRSNEACAPDTRIQAEPGLRLRLRPCTPQITPRPPTPTPPPTNPPPSQPDCRYQDCNPNVAILYPTATYYPEDEGCGSSTNQTDSCNSSSTEESPNSADGCSDDTDNPTAQESSGCEGDTTEETESCTIPSPRHPTRKRQGASFLGTGLPLTLTCLWQALRTQRLRRKPKTRNEPNTASQ